MKRVWVWCEQVDGAWTFSSPMVPNMLVMSNYFSKAFAEVATVLEAILHGKWKPPMPASEWETNKETDGWWSREEMKQ